MTFAFDPFKFAVLNVVKQLHHVRVGSDHDALVSGCSFESSNVSKNIVHHRERGLRIPAAVTIGAQVGERPE